MSIKAMAHYWDNGTFTSTEVLVILAIADNANDDGEAWPSIATIARKCRLDERTVRFTLKELSDPKICEDLGRKPALRIEKGAGTNRKKNKRGTHVYHLLEFQEVSAGSYYPPRGGSATILRNKSKTILRSKSKKAPKTGDAPSSPESHSGELHSGERDSGEQHSAPSPELRSTTLLEVTPERRSTKPSLITINKDEPPINIEEEEDDSVIHLWNVLEKIVDRPLTRSEYILLEQACGDEIGQDCALFAIEGLRAAWLKPDFRMRHDVTSYLQKVIANERKNREIQSKQRREKYMPTPPRGISASVEPRDEELPVPISAYEAALKNEPVSTQPATLSPHEELWKKTLGELHLQLATATFTSWLQNTKAVPGEGKTIVVETPSQYSRDWLENRLKGMVCRTLKTINKEFTEVQFVCSHAQSGMH